MNAAEFFRDVVKGNYEQFNKNRSDVRSLRNAIVSMNTVAEYVALHRLGYAEVSRDTLDKAAERIRDKHPILSDVKYYAETLKHVRKIKDNRKTGSFTTTATSTGVSSVDQATWKISSHDPVEVLQKALIALTPFSELN